MSTPKLFFRGKPVFIVDRLLTSSDFESATDLAELDDKGLIGENVYMTAEAAHKYDDLLIPKQQVTYSLYKEA